MIDFVAMSLLKSDNRTFYDECANVKFIIFIQTVQEMQ